MKYGGNDRQCLHVATHSCLACLLSVNLIPALLHIPRALKDFEEKYKSLNSMKNCEFLLYMIRALCTLKENVSPCFIMCVGMVQVFLYSSTVE